MVEGASAQPGPPIHITSPHGRLPATGPIRIVAQAQDDARTPVVLVRFYVDEVFVGDDAQGPVFAVEWQDENPFKPVVIRAEAFDANGATASDAVGIHGRVLEDP